MSTKELREKAAKAIEGLSDKALIKLIDLLDELRVGSAKESDDQLIDKIIEENREVLARLAK